MKIKITYSDEEKYKSAEIEEILSGLFSTGERLKIRKPKENQQYRHIYITIEIIKPNICS